MPVELSESKRDNSLNQTDAGFWPKLEARFRKLQAEADEKQGRGKCPLTACWNSATWDQSGKYWDLSGATRSIRTKYEWLAESAAVRLGHAKGPAALSFWLDLLKAESPNYRGGGSGTSEEKDKRIHYEVGTLEHPCEASADYCIKLETQERKAIEESQKDRPDQPQQTEEAPPGESGQGVGQPGRPSTAETEPGESAADADGAVDERQRSRKAFVRPILDAKGWSTSDWQNESKLTHPTAYDYMNGKRVPFTSTRKKLAGALGIPTEELPQ